MRAGVAKTIITPPLPVHLVGYSRERRTIEVADELAARALVLEADGQRVALLSAELLWLEHGQVETIRAQIAALCGLEPGAVMVACTHTHSGPDTLGWYDYAPLDEAWLATLLRQLAGCVWLACQRLRPVRAERVEGTLPVGICRRLRTENGMVIGQNPDGLYDDSAVGLRLLDEAGGLYASVVSAGVHPTSQGAEEPLVSADWPGVMCRLVERELGGTCLFVNGACGDVNARMPAGRGQAVTQRVGTAAGGAAIKLLAGPSAGNAAAAASDASEGAAVGAVRRSLLLTPREHPYLKAIIDRRVAADGGLRTEVQALRLGPLALVSLPGEVLTETGWAVQRATRLPGARIAGYTNDYIGYLPLAHIYEEGGYEPSAAMLPAEGVAELVAAAVGVGDDLAAR